MTYKTSSTLIDVILTNKSQAVNSLVFSCPFSNHCFVGACYNLEMDVAGDCLAQESFVWRRNLSKHRLERITELINEIPIDLLCSGKSIDEMWILFKTSPTRIIDQISLLKKVRINQAERLCPWFCAELKALSKSKKKLKQK